MKYILVTALLGICCYPLYSCSASSSSSSYSSMQEQDINEPTRRAISQEVRTFLEELSDDKNFKFTSLKPNKAEPQERLEILKLWKNENNPLGAIRACKTFLASGVTQDILDLMLDITKSTKLYPEAKELYLLEAYMIRACHKEGLPTVSPEGLFEEIFVKCLLGLKEKDQHICFNDLCFGPFEINFKLNWKAHNTFEENPFFTICVATGLLQDIMDADAFGNRISNPQKCYELGGLLLLKAGTPESLNNFATYVKQRKINFDEKRRPITSDVHRYEVVARLYWEAATPESINSFAALVLEGKIDKDEEGKRIMSDAQRYEVIRRLLLKAHTPESMTIYADLVLEGKIDKDEEGKRITSNAQLYQVAARLYKVAARLYKVAARLYLEVRTPEGMTSYADLVLEGKIDEDENGKRITSNAQLYQVAARLYWEAHTPESMTSYAGLILEGKIDKDEKGTLLKTNQTRLETILRILETNDLPNSYYLEQ